LGSFLLISLRVQLVQIGPDLLYLPFRLYFAEVFLTSLFVHLLDRGFIRAPLLEKSNLFLLLHGVLAAQVGEHLNQTVNLFQTLAQL
jgi:hypothetical protein